MDQLRFTGLYEDGQHAVLTAADGSEYLVVIDDRLRSAVRRPGASSVVRASPATPREVQTQIRGGASAEEVAESTGWTVERIERYEGPILAEREYVAGLARAALIRTHERSEAPPTLDSRARERLNRRGVDLGQVTWDSIRPAGGSWSVQVHFKAGQRARSASWSFDPETRSVDAIDDEARWLSEDEQSLPAGATATALLGGGSDAPDDLMSAMRERSKRRGSSGRRRRPATAQETSDPAQAADDSDDSTEQDGADSLAGLDVAASGRASQDPTAVPGQHDIPDTALSLEDLPYDPDTMGLPPAAGREELTEESDDAADSRDDFSVDGGGLDVTDEEEREATLADFFGSDDDDDDDDDGGSHVDDVDEVDDHQVPADDEVDDHQVLADDEGEGAVQVPASPDRDDKARSRGRKGRTSVPSWDDIMFGAKDRRR